MNEERALRVLCSGVNLEIPHYLCEGMEKMVDVAEDARKIAVKALEKQVARKPYFRPWDWDDDGTDGGLACPNCKDHLTDYVPNDCQKYCMNCGQKLDWNNVEET